MRIASIPQGLSCIQIRPISTGETVHTQILGGCPPRGCRGGRWGQTGTSSHRCIPPPVRVPRLYKFGGGGVFSAIPLYWKFKKAGGNGRISSDA